MSEALQITTVLIILVGAVTLFITEKLPMDLVAILVLAVLMMTGLLTPEESISGFSNPATITVGAMFILSAALTKTGALHAVARVLMRIGKRPFLLLLLIMGMVALASAFINNTPVVAVFLPIVLSICARRQISPSKLLIPLSFTSQFGGVCTLIGTSTNLLVSSISEHAGYGTFGMFEFSKLGIIFVAAGGLYLLVAGYWLLPSRRGAQLTETYQLGEYITELRVMPKSSLVGKTVTQSKFGKQYDVTVLEILRGQEKLWSPSDEPIQAGDILLVRGKAQDLLDVKGTTGLELDPQFKLADAELQAADLSLVETLVAPRSQLIGRTLTELDFRRHYNAIVLAIQRRGRTLASKLNDIRLRFGDALLLQSPKEEIAKFRADGDFLVLQEVDEPALRRGKAPLALAIIGLVVLFASTPIFGHKPIPILTTAVAGCIAMVLTRCVTLDEAYSAIDWRVIFLLAGVLPLGLAMEKTGTARLIAEQGIHLVGESGPIAALATVYLLTALLTEFISHNAAATLLAPIAISTALKLGVSPKPFLMAVVFAASTSFSTPVGYQTNTMIYNPGGYRFTDFMKVGIPLNLLFWILAVIFIPRMWPF